MKHLECDVRFTKGKTQFENEVQREEITGRTEVNNEKVYRIRQSRMRRMGTCNTHGIQNQSTGKILLGRHRHRWIILMDRKETL